MLADMSTGGFGEMGILERARVWLQPLQVNQLSCTYLSLQYFKRC